MKTNNILFWELAKLWVMMGDTGDTGETGPGPLMNPTGAELGRKLLLDTRPAAMPGPYCNEKG